MGKKANKRLAAIKRALTGVQQGAGHGQQFATDISNLISSRDINSVPAAFNSGKKVFNSLKTVGKALPGIFNNKSKGRYRDIRGGRNGNIVMRGRGGYRGRRGGNRVSNQPRGYNYVNPRAGGFSRNNRFNGKMVPLKRGRMSQGGRTGQSLMSRQANVMRQGNSTYDMFGKNRPVRIVAVDIVQPISSGLQDTDNIQNIPINFGLANFSPYTSQVSENFKYYRINKLSVQLATKVSTNSAGQWGVCFDYDPTTDPNSIAKINDVLTNNGSVCDIKMNLFQAFYPSKMVKLRPGAWQLLRQSNINSSTNTLNTQSQQTGINLINYDYGRLYVYTNTGLNNNTSMGELIISYDIEFSTPITNPIPPQSSIEANYANAILGVGMLNAAIEYSQQPAAAITQLTPNSGNFDTLFFQFRWRGAMIISLGGNGFANFTPGGAIATEAASAIQIDAVGVPGFYVYNYGSGGANSQTLTMTINAVAGCYLTITGRANNFTNFNNVTIYLVPSAYSLSTSQSLAIVGSVRSTVIQSCYQGQFRKFRDGNIYQMHEDFPPHQDSVDLNARGMVQNSCTYNELKEETITTETPINNLNDGPNESGGDNTGCEDDDDDDYEAYLKFQQFRERKRTRVTFLPDSCHYDGLNNDNPKLKSKSPIRERTKELPVIKEETWISKPGVGENDIKGGTCDEHAFCLIYLYFCFYMFVINNCQLFPVFVSTAHPTTHIPTWAPPTKHPTNNPTTRQPTSYPTITDNLAGKYSQMSIITGSSTCLLGANATWTRHQIFTIVNCTTIVFNHQRGTWSGGFLIILTDGSYDGNKITTSPPITFSGGPPAFHMGSMVGCKHNFGWQLMYFYDVPYGAHLKLTLSNLASWTGANNPLFMINAFPLSFNTAWKFQKNATFWIGDAPEVIDNYDSCTGGVSVCTPGLGKTFKRFLPI